jgi:uncharacterized protein YjbI with pentapeptide repeats
MADESLVSLLKQGVEAWNEWRSKHESARPNLSKSDLRGVVLDWTDLHEVNFSGANLSGAYLSGANLNLRT